MIARITMALAKASQYAEADICLFLPVEMGLVTQYGAPVIFKPELLNYPWPAVCGTWDRNDVFANVEFDEDEDNLMLTWNDGDEATLDVTDKMSLMVDRLLTHTSKVHQDQHVLRITAIRVL